MVTKSASSIKETLEESWQEWRVEIGEKSSQVLPV
jgi:hypothetical protein